jgi:hypothetical protein
VDLTGALNNRIQRAFKVIRQNFFSQTLAMFFCGFTVHRKALLIYEDVK